MQDYKLVIRSIVAGPTILNQDGSIVAQNASEAMAYLNEQYLTQDYRVLSVDLVRVIPADRGVPLQYEFAYHLVKEWGTSATPKGK